MRDLHHNLKAIPALDPTLFLANAIKKGAIIDTQGFESLELALQSGVITDGTYTPSLEHGDDVLLADAAAVPATDLLSTIAAVTFAGGDDNKAKRVGYRGSKRYVRLGVTPSGIAGFATGSIAFDGLVADDPVTVGATTFTAKAEPAGATEFAVGADDAESMANLVAKVNAHPTAGALVTLMDNEDASCDVTANETGTAGNGIALSSTSEHVTVSGAHLANGVAGGGRIAAVAILGNPASAPVA